MELPRYYSTANTGTMLRANQFRIDRGKEPTPPELEQEP
jgi:hypothetical protein